MLLRRLLTVLAAATATVAVSTPAHADFYYWQESGGAQVRFYPDSRVMKICDVGYDRHPVAEWYTSPRTSNTGGTLARVKAVAARRSCRPAW